MTPLSWTVSVLASYTEKDTTDGLISHLRLWLEKMAG